MADDGLLAAVGPGRGATGSGLSTESAPLKFVLLMSPVPEPTAFGMAPCCADAAVRLVEQPLVEVIPRSTPLPHGKLVAGTGSRGPKSRAAAGGGAIADVLIFIRGSNGPSSSEPLRAGGGDLLAL